MNWIPYMILGIFLLLGFSITLLSDYSRITKVLHTIFYLICSIMLIIHLLYTQEDQKEVDKRISNQNLSEYYKYYENKKGMTFEQKMKRGGFQIIFKGYTLTDLNLMNGPGNNFPVIVIIPKGEKVNIIHNELFSRDVNNIKDWYRISYNEKIGWVNGKYLKPEFKTKLNYSFFSKPIKFYISKMFPEETFFKKILGVVIVIPLIVLFEFILFLIFRNGEIPIGYGNTMTSFDLSFSVPIIYFIIKIDILELIDIKELMITFPVLMFLVGITHIPGMYIFKFFEDHWLKR